MRYKKRQENENKKIRTNISCFLCSDKATISKELFLARKDMEGTLESTKKYFYFCGGCYPLITPAFVDRGENSCLKN